MAVKTFDKEVENSDLAPPTSRYKEQRYFQRSIRGIGKRIEPELWNPEDILASDQDEFTEVGPGEVGRLDLVSARVYNGIEQLWWVIAYANGIIDPFEEVVSGLKLRYPPYSWIASNILA